MKPSEAVWREGERSIEIQERFHVNELLTFKINKSDGFQTSDAFRGSARVLVSELSFKRYDVMFSVLFCFILVEISDFPEIQLVCDLPTDGRL